MLILYAILAEASIIQLFIAAIIPGILATLGYMLAVGVIVWRDPDAAQSGRKRSLHERLAALRLILPIAVLFIVMLGGIYSGIFTPTEGASVGVVVIILIAGIQRRLSLGKLTDSVRQTATTTAMMFMILLGAEVFSSALAFTHLPTELASSVAALEWSPYLILAIMVVVYILLGCVMDGISMLFMTVPVFLPIVLGFDLELSRDELIVWFGIIALIVVEIGLITPPVGLNIFIINAIAEDVPMQDTIRKLVYFLFADLGKVILLILFPGLALGLLS